MSKRTFILQALIVAIIGMLFFSCNKDEAKENEKNKENCEFAFFENYVDSLDAIISNKGYVALFGGLEIPISENTSAIERVVYVTKCNLQSGDVDELDATLIVVDSTYVPTQIISKNGIMRFSQLENGHLCCLYQLNGQDEWVELDEIDYNFTNIMSHVPHTRSLATGGVSNFTIASVLRALDIVSGLKDAIQSTSLKECMSNGLGVFGNFIPNDEASLITGLVSAALKKCLNSSLLSILSYTGDKIADGPIKYLGPVRLSIDNVCQASRNTCNITYTITGLHEYGAANSWLYFELYKGQKRIDTIYLPSANGTVTKTIDKLEPGQYGVVLHIKTKKYHWEYWTSPTVNFSVFDLGLDRYEIEDNPSYSNGTVNFKMDVYLKGSEDGLNDIKEFGYYTRYSKTSPDYKRVSHLSSIFESTPLTYELSIERDKFFEKNYNTFEAKATSYYIGAYIVQENGDIVTIDEQEIEGLIYNQKPSIVHSNARIISCVETNRKTNKDGSEQIYYQTSALIDWKDEGSFWMDNAYRKSSKGQELTPFAPYDGTGTVRFNWTYSSSSFSSEDYWYVIHLTNGVEMRSSTTIRLSGTASNPTISID